MKNNILKNGLIELVFLIYIILLILLQINNINSIIPILNIAFFLLLGTIIYIKHGYAKSHKITKEITFQYIIICSLIYYFLIYMSGLFLGFLESPYSYNFITMLSNIIITAILIILEESFRYSYVRVNNSIKKLVLITILFITFDIITGISSYSFQNVDKVFEAIGLLILPSISKEILCTYLVTKSSQKATITYRIFQDVLIFILPIIPAFSTYIESVIKISIPILVLLFIDHRLEKYEKTKSKRLISKNRLYINLPIMLFLVILVVLVSGIFKYKLIAIGSESMSPTINKGDAVVIQKISKEDFLRLEKGNIIAFKQGGRIIVHRIHKIKLQQDEIEITTKGDANKTADDYEITYDNIVGIINLKVPYIGLPSIWVRELF